MTHLSPHTSCLNLQTWMLSSTHLVTSKSRVQIVARSQHLHVDCRADGSAVLRPHNIRSRLRQACRNSNMPDANMFDGSTVESRLSSMDPVLAEQVCSCCFVRQNMATVATSETMRSLSVMTPDVQVLRNVERLDMRSINLPASALLCLYLLLFLCVQGASTCSIFIV